MDEILANAIDDSTHAKDETVSVEELLE